MLRRIRRQLLAWRRNLPVKVVAVLAAGVLWWYAGTDPATTVQRSMLVPLEVTQVPADGVVVGVPDVVEVALSGPAARMDRVEPSDLRATLDLRDADGDFARSVEATVPPSLRTVRVVPSEVMGRVEALTRRELPVEALVRPTGARITSLAPQPERVALEGRAAVLDRVARVWVPVDGRDGEHAATPVAVDEGGRPVTDLEITPASVAVRVGVAEATVRTEVGVRLEGAFGENVRVALRRERVEVVGPAADTEALETVRATVGAVTEALPPGRYTLPVRLELPDGVAAFAVPMADVVVTEP